MSAKLPKTPTAKTGNGPLAPAPSSTTRLGNSMTPRHKKSPSSGARSHQSKNDPNKAKNLRARYRSSIMDFNVFLILCDKYNLRIGNKLWLIDFQIEGTVAPLTWAHINAEQLAELDSLDLEDVPKWVLVGEKT